MKIQFDTAYVTETLKAIMAVDSPSGFTGGVVQKLKAIVDALGYESYETNKGNLIVTVEKGKEKTVGLAAHVDTLGLMVRSVSENGALRFTPIGGPILPSLDGEYCRIHTREGKVYTGTILSDSPASHVFPDSGTAPRNADTMHIRIDEKTKTKQETLDLGIRPGDFICYESKTVITESGFIKSRFLDDKLSAVCILGVLKYMKDQQIELKYNLKVLFSCYEETGHGLSYLPEGLSEVIAVDMGCIGKDLSCTEYDVSICAKDSGGPYDYELTTRLIQLAKEHGVSYAVDIYPQYGSDVGAALKAGHDIKGALIGPGVGASHGMERSHLEAVESAMQLIYLYLTA